MYMAELRRTSRMESCLPQVHTVLRRRNHARLCRRLPIGLRRRCDMARDGAVAKLSIGRSAPARAGRKSGRVEDDPTVTDRKP